MEDFKRLSKGDTITLTNVDGIVKSYISQYMFKNIGEGGIELDILRAYCKLKPNKKYKISSNCYSCKFLHIDIGKGNLKIRYGYIKSAIQSTS